MSRLLLAVALVFATSASAQTGTSPEREAASGQLAAVASPGGLAVVGLAGLPTEAPPVEASGLAVVPETRAPAAAVMSTAVENAPMFYGRPARRRGDERAGHGRARRHARPPRPRPPARRRRPRVGARVDRVRPGLRPARAALEPVDPDRQERPDGVRLPRRRAGRRAAHRRVGVGGRQDPPLDAQRPHALARPGGRVLRDHQERPVAVLQGVRGSTTPTRSTVCGGCARASSPRASTSRSWRPTARAAARRWAPRSAA